MLQAARGLKCAHDQNMFHRDLSPEVLIVDRQGLVKVVDLGLAKTPDADAAEEAVLSGKPIAVAPSSGQTTLPSISIGTPGYMAPELANNPAGAGPRTDIYSLGCTLYFLLTGQPPFEGKNRSRDPQPAADPTGPSPRPGREVRSEIALRNCPEDGGQKARRSLCRHGRRHPRPRGNSRYFERRPDLKRRRAVHTPGTERNRLARVAIRATSRQGHHGDPRAVAPASPW